MKSLQRINVGCVCADGVGTMCCSLVVAPSVALAPGPHGDGQCMPWGGSWKVHGGVPGAEPAGQLVELCDLEGARPGVALSIPWLR